eukprot:UN34161
MWLIETIWNTEREAAFVMGFILCISLTIRWFVSLRTFSQTIDPYSSGCWSRFKTIVYIFPVCGIVIYCMYDLWLVLVSTVRLFFGDKGYFSLDTEKDRNIREYYRITELLAESLPAAMVQLFLFLKTDDPTEEEVAVLSISFSISILNSILTTIKSHKKRQGHMDYLFRIIS